MAKFSASYYFLTIALMMLILSGCAGKKGAVKNGLSADATETEKKEFALKLFREGSELLYNDDQAALLKFDQAREVDPSFIPAHFNAGVALEALNKPQEALTRYDACLAQNKQQPNCLDNWILVKASLEQFDEATARMDAYLTEFSEAAFPLIAAAKLALMRKDYAGAERYARQAIERESENVEALFVMARIFYERKQYPAAKWVLKNALEISPSHGGLHLLLGHTETELDLLHEALDSYAKAVKTAPTEEALESYGLLLLKRGRVLEALPVLKRLMEIRPDDARNLVNLGNAYMANKMVDDAKASYLSALAKNPQDLDVNFNLGLLYFDNKQKDLPEIERYKTAKNYFEAYAKKPGISKERQAEVKEYLGLISQKIEMEEYRAESAKSALEEEEKVEPKELEKPEEEEVEKAPEKTEPIPEEEKVTMPKADIPPPVTEEEVEKEEKPKTEEPKDKKKKEPVPEGFEEEEEEFFDEF